MLCYTWVDTEFNSLQEGAEAKLACNPGYYVSGETYLTCNDGSWGDNVGQCQGNNPKGQTKKFIWLIFQSELFFVFGRISQGN